MNPFFADIAIVAYTTIIVHIGNSKGFSYELKCDTGLYNIILLDGDNYTSERSGTSDIITSKQYDDL